MIEVNLEHMDFVHRDFVTRNSEKINEFLDMDGGKVPSRVKGVNFGTIPQLLLNEICNTWESCVKEGKTFDDFLMYCEDNFSSDDLFKDFFRHQRNQISDLEETKKLELGSEYEISNLIWNKSDLLDYLDVFVESCSSYLLPKISFSSNSSQLN